MKLLNNKFKINLVFVKVFFVHNINSFLIFNSNNLLFKFFIVKKYDFFSGRSHIYVSKILPFLESFGFIDN